jgi:hypothetical protein
MAEWFRGPVTEGIRTYEKFFLFLLTGCSIWGQLDSVYNRALIFRYVDSLTCILNSFKNLLVKCKT